MDSFEYVGVFYVLGECAQCLLYAAVGHAAYYGLKVVAARLRQSIRGNELLTIFLDEAFSKEEDERAEADAAQAEPDEAPWP